MAKKNSGKESHIVKDINEMKNISIDLVKNTQEMATKFTKLPWKKLPPIGWFYIIFLALIVLIIAIFIVPNIL